MTQIRLANSMVVVVFCEIKASREVVTCNYLIFYVDYLNN